MIGIYKVVMYTVLLSDQTGNGRYRRLCEQPSTHGTNHEGAVAFSLMRITLLYRPEVHDGEIANL